MASWMGGLRVVMRSRALLRPALLQSRRPASQMSMQGNENLLIAGAVGIMGITTYLYYRSNKKKPDYIGLNQNSRKTSQYAITGAVHPEAEAEKMLSDELAGAEKKVSDELAGAEKKVSDELAGAEKMLSDELAGAEKKVSDELAGAEKMLSDKLAGAEKMISDELAGAKKMLSEKLTGAKNVAPGHIPYVLVGAGTASFAAAKAIREKDPTAKVLIIGEEQYTPYSRPPLSKQLWLYEDHEAAKQLKFKASWSEGKVVDPFYKADYCDPSELLEREEGGIAVVIGTKVVGLSPSQKKLTLDDSSELTYDKCLLATGGIPKNLPIFTEDNDVKAHSSVYRKVPDYLSLDNLASTVGSILIVGGGFLGSELAVGLANRGKERGLKVTQIFPEEGNLGLVLPKELTKWTTEKVRKEGVDVHPGVEIAKANYDGGKVRVTTKNEKEFEADHVVVAVGLAPNTQLAKSARLETDPKFGGYLVNAELQACSDVWAAGDAACFYDPHLGRRREEHHDHANVSGRLAGYNMAGNHERFAHQSMFWSDLGPEVGFEATGLIDSKLPTVGIWARKSEEESDIPVDDYSKGVVFYLSQEEKKRVVGVLTWNLFGKMDIAKQVIADARGEADIGEIATQFDIHQ